MINSELARVLARIADLLEIDGAEGFRVNTYRRAARTIKNAVEDVRDIAAEGRLTGLPGIGKGTAQRIEQFIDTGRIDVLDELQNRIPKGLPELLEIPGMGSKKTSLVYHKLGVTCLADLQRAIESGDLAALPGMGVASVKKVAEGISFLQQSGGRTPIGIAQPVAESLVEQIRHWLGVQRVEIAGSLRRGSETIGDIDILCDANEGEETVRAFVALDSARRVLAAGRTKGSIAIALDENRELQVDLRVVPAESFGAALQYFTGSKEHNVKLRELAVRKKWRLNEYGLFDGDQAIAGANEEEIYAKLGLPFVPPELREDIGEFGNAAGYADLVTLGAIHGDLHMHTTASDGKCSIEEMARAVLDLGYEYIAICDHSKSATIAGGLSEDRMLQHIESIHAVDAGMEGIKVLVGCECDILADGSLDYEDSLLSECDWVVASIHSGMSTGKTGKLTATDRTIKAMENRYVSAIGHPTGRLINRRPPMDIDMQAVIEAAARSSTLLEINANFHRLDLKDVHVRQAVAAGVTLTINTDAHHTDQLTQMRYGVTTARRGGATVADVLNCLPLDELQRRVAAKRGNR